MERVVDIATDRLFLAVSRGFLTVHASGEEKARIALDDIDALIVHAHGTGCSNAVNILLWQLPDYVECAVNLSGAELARSASNGEKRMGSSREKRIEETR